MKKNTLYICKKDKGLINMNIAIRKLVMLEKSMAEKEEAARIAGYTTCPIDTEFKRQISDIMNKVKAL